MNNSICLGCCKKIKLFIETVTIIYFVLVMLMYVLQKKDAKMLVLNFGLRFMLIIFFQCHEIFMLAFSSNSMQLHE